MDLAGIPCREVSDALRGPLRRTNQNGSRNSRKIVARRRRPIYSLSISLRRSEIDAQSQVLRTKPRMRTPHLTPPVIYFPPNTPRFSISLGVSAGLKSRPKFFPIG